MADILVNTQQLIDTETSNTTNNKIAPEVDEEPINMFNIKELIQKFEGIIRENKKKEEKEKTKNNVLVENEPTITIQQSENSIRKSPKDIKNEDNLLIKEEIQPVQSGIENLNKLEKTQENALKEKEFNEKNQDLLIAEEIDPSYKETEDKEILPKKENNGDIENLNQLEKTQENALKEKEFNKKNQDLLIAEEPDPSYKETGDKEILPKEESNGDVENQNKQEINDERELKENLELKITSNNQAQPRFVGIYKCPIITEMFARHREREEKEKKYGIVKRTYKSISRRIKEFFGCSNRNERIFYERNKDLE